MARPFFDPMTGRWYHRMLWAAAMLAAVAPAARAQAPFEWHRATVGVVTGAGPATDALEAMARKGVTVLLWRDAAEDDSGFHDAVRRASARGLHVILVTDADSGGVGEARVVGSEDDPFRLVTSLLPPLPRDPSALEEVFARRARSAGDPAVAPLAVAGSAVDERWYLTPGPIAVPDGPLDGATAAAAAFRAAHPAVAGGVHRRLQESPYAFYRGLRIPDGALDEVIVTLGAAGKTRLNVAAIFPDDTVLRDAVTGRLALVSFGHVTFAADGSGLILAEPVE